MKAAPAVKAAEPSKAAPAKPVAKPAVDPKPTRQGVAVALAGNPASPVTAPRKPGKVAVAVVGKRVEAPAPKGKLKVVPYQTDEATGRPIVPAGYKPTADEEYMSALQLEYFRQRLLQWRADLVEESKQQLATLQAEISAIKDRLASLG